MFIKSSFVQRDYFKIVFNVIINMKYSIVWCLLKTWQSEKC